MEIQDNVIFRAISVLWRRKEKRRFDQSSLILPGLQARHHATCRPHQNKYQEIENIQYRFSNIYNIILDRACLCEVVRKRCSFAVLVFRGAKSFINIVGPWHLEFVNHGDYYLELCLGDTWEVHLGLPAAMSK